MKRRLKLIFAALLYYTGVEWLLRRLFPRRNPAIIMFHSVQEKSPLAVAAKFCVDPRTFEKQIRFLRRYNCVSMSSITGDSQGGAAPRRDAVVVTFDDGYADNYHNAYPILKKYGVPAVVYLASEYIGTDRWLPLNRLYDAVYRTTLTTLDLPPALRENRAVLRIATEEEKRAALVYLRRQLKLISVEKFEWIVDEVCAQLLQNGAPARGSHFDMLSWSQVRSMTDLVEFGSHTASHCILSRAEDDRLVTEIYQSKSAIEKETNTAVVHFAYPNGRANDYDARAVATLRQAGYQTAVTTRRGISCLEEEPLELKRLSLGDPRCVIAFELLGITVAVRRWLGVPG